jgi:hypothetical protein
MKNLFATLTDYDAGMLPALGEVWGIDTKKLKDEDILQQLMTTMLNPDKTEAVWENLEDSMRSAMQLLISTSSHRMKTSQFERVFGEIRKLGRAKIKKEKPHKATEAVAEGLYYRGLIAEAFDKADDGSLISFVYVPSDLVKALPLHKTMYEHLEDEEVFPEEEIPSLEIIDAVQNIIVADTSIIDDMTTLLAYLQAFSADVAGDSFTPDSTEAIMPYLLRQGEIRLSFLLGIGITADLITTQEGKAYPRRTEARQWLNASRAEQTRQLAQAWLGSTQYQDMWHIPGLFPDDSGWAYDPVRARNSVASMFTDLVPEQGWNSVNALIDMIKESEPDFQRPNGDYDSWYIRNASGEFLNGFESWDAVEGALIEFYMMGPMHWLGLVDVGDDAIRLTAYGRAFLQIAEWPQVSDEDHPIEIRDDGTLLASRRVNRFERFQLARFTEWVETGDPFVYALNADSIQRANTQGITPQHIQAFVARQLGSKPIPTPIITLLKNWQGGATGAVTFETLIVLRTTSPEVMDKIFDNPDYRRYLGARLGSMACIIREDHWAELRASLGEQGMDVDISGI